MNQKEFMEKNSLSNSLKDHSLVNSRACNKHCNNKNNNNNNSDDGKNKLKDSWNHSSQSHGGGGYLSKKSHGEDYLGGISWPPRSYTCSFCKREFRSAQALGGHMNVHRRDRARLRQSPPPRDGQFPLLNLNLCPNPNPNFSSPSFTSTLPALVSPSLSALSSAPFASSSENKKRDVADPKKSSPHPKRSGLTKMETRKSLLDVEEFEGFTDNDGCKFLKNAEIVSLDLEIGLFSDAKEDLDLELRLGYS